MVVVGGDGGSKNAPSCVVFSDYEVRIASLRVSDTGRTRPSLSRFRPLRRRNSSDQQREKRPQSLDDLLAGEAPRRMRSGKAEQWWEDDHDRGGPHGEDGQVGGLPALEPVEPAASCEESGGEPGGPGQVHE